MPVGSSVVADAVLCSPSPDQGNADCGSLLRIKCARGASAEPVCAIGRDEGGGGGACAGDATMARRGESVSVTGLLLLMATAMWWDGVARAVAAQQLRLIHKYAHLDGSRAKSAGQGMTPGYFQTLRAHDRRRLATVIDFPLNGSLGTSGLYYTQISLGTPARPYTVLVDTGSYVTWLDCTPCPSCPRRSDIPGVTLSQYDPTQSSTDTVLPCHSPDCQIASFGNAPACTNPLSPQACPFEITYVDGSWTSGYLLNDVMTFNMVANSTALVTTANVYFGCGHNQSATALGVDGLMGFAQAAISVPNQLANQKKTGAMFAHCLQGADSGGGNIVMGNITEPDIVYTPILPNQTLYNVGLQNIAVNGSNITSAASFALGPEGTGGCVIDSGTTTALLINPVHEQFVAAVAQQAPVPLQPLHQSDGNGTIPDCFIYSGILVGTFPDVQLFFDGGAVMNLGPSNYLQQLQLVDGETAYCIVWMPSTYYTIFGDIVLQDQLVVYDLDKQRVGWKPFDCTKAIAVDNGTDATTTGRPPAEAPAYPPERGTHSGAHDGRTRRSTYVIAAWVALAAMQTVLV